MTLRAASNCLRLAGEWQQWTWAQYLATVTKVAQAYLKLGVKERHAVAIIGFNSPEWVFSWAGAAFIGAMGTGIYATNSPDSIAYVIQHSQARPVSLLETIDHVSFAGEDSHS